MLKLTEEGSFKIILISILSVSLVLVVVLGRIKQDRELSKWKEVLNVIEASRKVLKEDKTVNQEDNNILPQEEISKGYIYKGASTIGEINNSRWKDKTWYAVGDNITSGNGYQSKVKNALGISSVTTDAAIGKLMKDMASNIDADKLKDFDLITVFGGTADYSLNIPLGTIKDDENSNTYYGNVHKTIKKIIDSKPEITIVFFTPLKRGNYKNYAVYPNPNSAGVKLEDYVKAIKDVCQSYNILVYDLFNDSGINEDNLKNYLTDGLNLNTAGYSRISTLIANYLKTVK